MLKIRFLKKVKKKIISFGKSKEILCPWWESNQGPMALQTRTQTTTPWRKLKILAIFHQYILNICKNQLSLKKTTTPQTYFGLYNMGSEMHSFSATVI